MSLSGVSTELHVLTLTPFFPSDKNPVDGCYVSEPLARFRQLGVDSTVIAVSPVYHPRKHSAASAAANWIRYPQLPGNFGLATAGKLLYFRLLEQLRQLHATKAIDIIHAHAALPCGHAAMLLSKSLKIPFVVTVHGLDVFNNCHLGGAPAAARRKVSAEVYRAASSVICISSKVQEILQAGMQEEVHSTVVYNGVDPNLFSPPEKLPEEAAGPMERRGSSPGNTSAASIQLEILVVGTLLPSKGHELVLKALAKLKPNFPALHCTIIGEGPYRAEYEALANSLGLHDQVRFAGRKSRTEVAAAMQNCTIFALPSHDEALGCVYLEAMSCAKPVIGCTGQGIEEIIEHGANGWLIQPEGLDQLVQTISASLESPQLCDRIGAAARRTILENLTLQHQAQHLVEVYRQGAT